MRKTINNINEKERKKITNFLKINDNEIAVPVSQLPGGIEGTINLISEKGKIIISEKGNEIIGILLMTFGEPSKNFTNIEIGYLYLAIFNKDNRGSKEMLSGVFQKIIEETSKKGIKIIRFKADAAEKNTNKLYSKFANLIGHEKNTQGIECNLYEVEVDKLKTSFFDNGEFRPLLKS